MAAFSGNWNQNDAGADDSVFAVFSAAGNLAFGSRNLEEDRMGYTVEAAGVMAVIFFTIMTLIGHGFRVRAEVAGTFALHEAVEQSRHAIEQIEKTEISMESSGRDWNREICADVFRPEKELRLWSLVEAQE